MALFDEKPLHKADLFVGISFAVFFLVFFGGVFCLYTKRYNVYFLYKFFNYLFVVVQHPPLSFSPQRFHSSSMSFWFEIRLLHKVNIKMIIFICSSDSSYRRYIKEWKKRGKDKLSLFDIRNLKEYRLFHRSLVGMRVDVRLPIRLCIE